MGRLREAGAGGCKDGGWVGVTVRGVKWCVGCVSLSVSKRKKSVRHEGIAL